MATNLKNKALADSYISKMLSDKGFREDLTTILKKDKADEKDDFFIQLIVLDISGKTGYLFEMDEFKAELKNKLGLSKAESEPQSE